MKKRRLHIAWWPVVFLWALAWPVFGQYLYVQDLSREAVLPTRSINSIAVDQSGVIWFGANTGLFQYDGLHCDDITLFSPVDSQVQRQIHRVMIDRSDVVYLGLLNNGLGILEPGRPLQHYKSRPVGGGSTLHNNAIDDLVDLDDRVLLIFERNGMAFYHKKSKTFSYFLPSQHFPALEQSARSDILYVGTADPARPGDAWISGAAGLFHWDGRQQHLSFFPMPPGFSPRAPGRTLYLHTDRKLYLGGWEAGLHIFDTENCRWERRIESAGGLDLRIISFIGRKSENELWINSYQVGLCSYQLYTGQAAVSVPFYPEGAPFTDPQRSLDADVLRMVPVDNHSWCLLKSTNRGLAFLYGQQQLFRKFQTGVDMHRVIPNPAGVDYLITNRAYLLQRDRRTGSVLPLPITPFLGDGGFRDGFSDGHGNYYVAGWKGVYRFRPGDRMARHVSLPLLDSIVRAGIVVQTALYDRQGQTWLGTNRGVYLARLTPPVQERWLVFADTTNGQPVLWAGFQDVHESPDGKIWLAGDQGIAMTPDGGQSFQLYRQADFHRAGIGVADFSTLQHDAAGRLWVGNDGEGLGYFRYDQPLLGNYHPLPAKAGNPPLGHVSSLTPDRLGNLWGIFPKGLFRLDTRDGSIQVFGSEFGLPESRLYTLDTLSGGYLLAGSDRGYFLFRPDEVMQAAANTSTIRVYQAHLLGRDQPDTLLQPGRIDLRYPQNGVHLQLVARPYWLNTHLQLRYRLDGLPGTWSHTGVESFTLWNAPVGEYRLQIQAADGLGCFHDENILTIPVRVLPAWWQTAWFRTGVLLSLLAAGGLGWYSRQRRREADLILHKRLVEMELNTLRAQINPHFIFNSLNTIKWQVVNGERRKAEEYIDRFSSLVRAALQYSTQPFISLEDEVEFLQQYVAMEQIRFKDDFEFQLDLPADTGWTLVQVPPMILQPYVENAIRHGLLPKEQGERQLSLYIAHQDDRYSICIRDNGIGRVAAHRAKASPRHQSFGMHLSNDRLALLAQTLFLNLKVEVLDLYDKKGQAAGTEVRLTFRYAG